MSLSVLQVLLLISLFFIFFIKPSLLNYLMNKLTNFFKSKKGKNFDNKTKFPF